MDCLSKPQAFMLASFSLGMAQAKQCMLHGVAQSLASLGKPDTVERRLQRFLSNPRLEFPKCTGAWANWVLSSLAAPEMVLLLIDETSLKDRLKVMAVSLAYHAKAIPLPWKCYPPKQRSLGQVVINPAWLRELSRGRVRRKSLFQLGLSYLQRWIDLGRQLSCHLCLIPRIPDP
jgi:hypothetical protein